VRAPCRAEPAVDVNIGSDDLRAVAPSERASCHAEPVVAKQKPPRGCRGRSSQRSKPLPVPNAPEQDNPKDDVNKGSDDLRAVVPSKRASYHAEPVVANQKPPRGRGRRSRKSQRGQPLVLCPPA